MEQSGERVVIFGAGRITEALVPLLAQLGFCTVVFDCTPEAADPVRFPAAARTVCGDYARISGSLTLTEADYAVVLTRGHQYDFAVQEQLLRQPLAYIGVISARGKVPETKARLEAAGVPETELGRLHSPIGTAIGAVTSAELAVSIAGELVSVRAARRGDKPKGCPMKRPQETGFR